MGIWRGRWWKWRGGDENADGNATVSMALEDSDFAPHLQQPHKLQCILQRPAKPDLAVDLARHPLQRRLGRAHLFIAAVPTLSGSSSPSHRVPSHGKLAQGPVPQLVFNHQGSMGFIRCIDSVGAVVAHHVLDERPVLALEQPAAEVPEPGLTAGGSCCHALRARAPVGSRLSNLQRAAAEQCTQHRPRPGRPRAAGSPD